jgi:hypothetical protein
MKEACATENGVKLECPKSYEPDKLISDLATELDGQMILVVKEKSNPGQLLGVITPFDLL